MCTLSEEKHFHCAQRDCGKKRARFLPGEIQNDAERRTNSGGDKERLWLRDAAIEQVEQAFASCL